MGGKSGSAVTGMRIGRGKRRLRAGVAGAALALALACAFPSTAWADDYVVNNEAELVAALAAAASNPDPSARIVFGASFSVSNATFTLPNKPLTFDTQGFLLTGPSGDTITISGPSNQLLLSGTITGASGSAGSGFSFSGTGTVISTATITGGAVGSAGQTPTMGFAMDGAMSFVNNGTIRGGDAISYTHSSNGSSFGAGVSINFGGTLTNNGLIQGGNSQGDGASAGIYSRNLSGPVTITNNAGGTIRGGSDATGVFAGNAAIRGFGGTNAATIINAGTIEGGVGAAAIASYALSWNVQLINSGIVRAGAGGADAIRMDAAAGSRLALELRAGSDIQGNVIASTGGNDILRLGGAVDSSFAISAVGPAVQYRNFDSFEKTGVSTWTLTGDSAVTTNWTISQGTLALGSGATTGPVLGNVANNAVLAFTGSGAASVTGVISGSGAVRQTGTGTTTLSATNTYTGGTLITGGVLSVVNDAGLGDATGAVTIDGGTLQVTGGSFTASRTINWGANGGTFDVTNSAASFMILQPLTSGGALVKQGGGRVVLAGDNSYTGGTTILAGALQIGNGGTTGSILGDVLNNGTLTFNRSTAYTFAGSITGSGGVAVSGTGMLTLVGNSSYGAGTTINGVNSGLLVNGGNTVVSGGATSITRAMLSVDGTNSVFSTTAINATGGTGGSAIVNVNNGGTLRTTVGDLNLRAVSTVSAVLNIAGANSLVDVAGGMLLATNANNVGTINIGAGGTLRTAGTSQIGSTGGNTTAPTVAITGAGANWTSTGSLNLNTGSITLADTGLLRVDGTLTLAATAALTGVLNLGGAEGQLAAAAGALTAPTLVFGPGTGRLNFNHTATGTGFVFGGAISGAGAINQVAGVTNLTGTSTGFTGTTTVSGGTLRVNGALGGATSIVNVQTGGRLGGAGTIGGNVAVTDGVLAPGNSPGTLTIAGDLSLTGASVLDFELGQANVAGGPLNDLIVVGGNLVLDGTINVTESAGGSFGPGVYRLINYAGTLTNNGLSIGTLPAGSSAFVQTVVANQVNLVNTAGLTLNFWDGPTGPKNDGLIQGGNGTWRVADGQDNWTDTNGLANADYAQDSFAVFQGTGGTVTVDNGGGNVRVSGMQFASDGYTITGDALTLTAAQAIVQVGDGSAASAGYTATVASELAGSAGLVKTDAGMLVLTAANSYAGGTTIDGGTLQIGNGGTTGSIVGNVVTTGDGVLAFNRSNAVTFGGIVSGTGGVSQVGTGTTTLTGVNIYSGGTTINGGVLQVSSDANLGDAAGGITFNGGTLRATADLTSNRDIVLAGAGTITTAAGADWTLAGDTTGAGTLTVATNNSFVTLTGNATHTGGTIVTGTGWLRIGDNTTTGSISGDITNNGIVRFSRSDTYDYNGTITGSGQVQQIATGVLNLTGNSSYSGSTLIQSGELRIASGNTISSANQTTVSRGGTLTVSGAGSALLAGTVDLQGSNGTTSINVENGGAITTTGSMVIQAGGGTPASANLNISGAASLVDLGGSLSIASSNAQAIGNVFISAGGALRSTGGNLIGAATGNMTEPGVIITGASSNWTSTGTLAMGNGNLSLLAGGAASFASATIGSADEGASLTVSGANSIFATTGDLVLGAAPGGTDTASSGAITLADGGTLSVGGTFTFTATAAATGVLNIGGAEGQAAAGAGIFGSSTLAFGPGTGRLNFNHTDTGYEFANAISGAGAINQVAGVTSLTGNSAGFTGTTTVSGGTLRVNGTLGGATSTVNVQTGGRLGGAGTIGGNVNVTDGVLAPGNSPGTLTIAGNLSLTGASLLAFEFGQAGTAGGALNDLINVGGDLALDGTIDVTQSAGGSFGPGLYRIINYAGALTNDGLTVGTMPAGSQAFVQTLTPGQVNLVNTAGLTLGFWDGRVGPKNDGAIQGGVGTWRVGGGENNWTEASGAVNADYAQDSFAIFSGLGGTVTIDNGNGNVRAAGLQFTVDGYTLMGGPLELTGTQAFVRVGDGSAGDAAITATIASALTGSARLVKDMGGTLILTGANSYTGGTAINGGTLDVSSDANLGDATGGLSFDGGTLDITTSFASNRAVDLVGTGTFRTQGTGFVLRGVVSGAGALVKEGNGSLTLTADNSHTGGTTINAGVLNLGEGGTTGSILGNIVNNGRLAINRSNLYTLTGTISGSGELFQAGTGTTILTAANSYTGTTRVSAGTLLINGDQSAATGLTSLAANTTLGGTGTIGGDVRVGGGTLAPGAGGAGTLTINGDLSMVSASHLAFDFGRANAPGDPLNDLVNVGGDLVLDGTIDVAVTPGGAFDIGLYRIANYAGTLTNNGLAIGTMPAGAELAVQTSILGQVNLVNTGSAVLNFWDGNTGPKFNGAVDGGSGVWWATGTDNWTDATGAVNASYDNGAFAVFAGRSGLVTIDNSQGAVTASGLQIAASGGYVIQGGALTLTGPQSVIRVGDGTTAGIGYSATIISGIIGNTQLVKTDLGRLVLAGVNSYTGGTAVNGGTLRISSDANLGAASGGISFNGGTLNTTADLTSARAVDLAGQGVFSTDAGTTLTLTGNLTGAGLIGKVGAGTLVLAGTGSRTGGIEVVQGTLLVNGNYAAATGLVTMNQITTLGGTGTIGGNVNLAGILAPGANGVGTLTINGNLGISPTATLAYEFGAANVVGGALNDLVNVGGNLILDGTINVSVPTGGAFSAGIYRVFNYGGTLTNNGLTLGALPAGSNVAVQTSIAGQVNLVNFAGLALGFWDGAAGPKNNGVINGGTGVWQNGSGNDNWTDASGAVNAPYSDGGFAVFGGTAGTVTVDNSLGQVAAGGMQFATGGYTVAGGGIALAGAQATIRVGDGSAAGAGYVATVNAALSGASQLVKTDAGTLVLGGANSYTGGTLVTGGTVQIAADANLGAATGDVTLDGGTLATTADLTSARSLALTGAGTVSTASGTTFTLGGALSGAGALTKAGAGTLLLSGNSAGYSGATSVAGGTLAVTGVLGGTVSVGAGARLEGTGSTGSVANAGTVAPGRDGFGTLTVNGNYAGAGGTLHIDAELSGDGAHADRLVVNGTTAGTTRVEVTNQGGLGAPTIDGIKIVDVGGASNGVFTLDGDYVFEGDPALVAGAYAYRLLKNGVTTPADGDWYLRSALLQPVAPPDTPLYQPGVPVYEAYGQTLLALSDIGTMQERTGNRQWAGGAAKSFGIWGRMESKRARPNAVASTSLGDVNVDSWKLELGADQVLSERSDGASLVIGVIGGYGEADASIGSVFGNGSIKTKGYSAGATMSWFGPQGFYVDGRAQLTWFDTRLKSSVLGKLAGGNDGTGQAYSLEVGKRAPIGGSLSVTPQIQTVYSTVSFDGFTDPNGASVSSRLGDSLRTRWGLSIDRQDAASHLYAVGNLSYEWLDGTVTDVSGTPIARENHRLWGELGLGGSVTLGGRLVLYSEVSGNTALNDFGKSYSLKGVAGLRLAF